MSNEHQGGTSNIIVPGPIPTLMISAPLRISSSTISPVTTLPALWEKESNEYRIELTIQHDIWMDVWMCEWIDGRIIDGWKDT